MSRQRTTRSIYRHNPTAASRDSNGISSAGDGGFNFIPHVVKATIRREPKAPPTRTEMARWLSATRRKYPQFSWDHFTPAEELIRQLQASNCHRNACTHFKNYFNIISKRFSWKWSREDVLSAWRHTPEDLKAAWNGIFQANNKPAKASGGTRDRVQMTNSARSHVHYEPIHAQMSMPSTSNVGFSGLPETVPAFSNGWNSLPTYFGSPSPRFGVIEAKWHNFYERYPPAPQVGAEVPIYVPPSLSQEWTLPPPSGVYPHPSGYSSPASAASSPLAFAGPSYFAANNSYGSYISPSEHHHEYPETSQAAPTNDFGHQIDLDFSLQPLNGSLPEAPLVSLDTDRSSFLPDLGQAFESQYTYTHRQFNSFEEYPEGSARTGSGVEDLFGSYNGPVEPDFAFDAGRADPTPNFGSPNAYELLAMGIDLWGPA